jgi:hypothetical protein
MLFLLADGLFRHQRNGNKTSLLATQRIAIDNREAIVLPLDLRIKGREMSETSDSKRFRIWAAVAIAVFYAFLAASGNA